MKSSRSVKFITLRRAFLLAGLTVFLGGISAVYAQDRRLHQYVAPEIVRRTSLHVNEGPIRTKDGVDAIKHGGDLVKAPATTEPTPEDPSARLRSLSGIRPDGETEADAALGYTAVFNPSIAPLKRLLVFDALGPDYTFRVPSGRKHPLKIGGVSLPGRRAFWAQIDVSPAPGGVPMASLGPDMRILKVQFSGSSSPSFSRDAAGGFFVHGESGKRIQITLLVDVAESYFGGYPLPNRVALNTLKDHPAAKISPEQRRVAKRVARQIKVRGDMSYREGIGRLTGYFRSFEAGKLKRRTDDIYLDIALSKLGVCRHRAFAFAVTSRGLGVPTRVVYNEAHAFVEVRVPGGGWRRIDLGGVAPSLTIRQAKGRVLDDPPADDLPTPENYRKGYSFALLGKPFEDAGGSPALLKGVPRRIDRGIGRSAVKAAPRAVDGPSQPERLKRSALKVVLDDNSAHFVVHRGRGSAKVITGRVVDPKTGRGVQDAVVRAVLVPKDGGERIEMEGRVPSDAQGRFVLPVTIPAATEVGAYLVETLISSKGSGS